MSAFNAASPTSSEFNVVSVAAAPCLMEACPSGVRELQIRFAGPFVSDWLAD